MFISLIGTEHILPSFSQKDISPGGGKLGKIRNETIVLIEIDICVPVFFILFEIGILTAAV